MPEGVSTRCVQPLVVRRASGGVAWVSLAGERGRQRGGAALRRVCTCLSDGVCPVYWRVGEAECHGQGESVCRLLLLLLLLLLVVGTHGKRIGRAKRKHSKTLQR